MKKQQEDLQKNISNITDKAQEAKEKLQEVIPDKDKLIAGAQQATNLIKNSSQQIFEKGGDLLNKGEDLYKEGEKKLSNLEHNIIDLEHNIEDKFEAGEQKIKQHSKKLRYMAAIFFFPVWFSFYILINTTLATWDIFVSVYRKIDHKKTGKKIIYTLSMCCFGCGVMQIILLVMSVFGLKCEEFKQETHLQEAFKKLACDTNSDAAVRLEQSLSVFFGNYQQIQSSDGTELKIITPNNNQDLEQQLMDNDKK